MGISSQAEDRSAEDIIRIHAMMEKSTQCLAYREEAPQIESVSKRAELPKFTPEQFPECTSRLP
jgi:hypothetical protein